MTRDALAELIILVLGVVIFAGFAAVCSMAAFGSGTDLPGGRLLPVIGLVASLSMVSFAVWRLSALQRAGRP
jgi:hypothetical protein